MKTCPARTISLGLGKRGRNNRAPACCTRPAGHDGKHVAGDWPLPKALLVPFGLTELGTARPEDTYCPSCDVFGHAQGALVCPVELAPT